MDWRKAKGKIISTLKRLFSIVKFIVWALYGVLKLIGCGLISLIFKLFPESKKNYDCDFDDLDMQIEEERNRKDDEISAYENERYWEGIAPFDGSVSNEMMKDRYQLYMEEARAAYNSAVEQPHNVIEEQNISTAHKILNIIHSGGYGEIWSQLDRLSLPSGMSFWIDLPIRTGLGDMSRLYIKKADGTLDCRIWDHIWAENSIEGAWQAFLVFEMWQTLPMFWHACYNHRQYLYSEVDIETMGGYESYTSFDRDSEKMGSSLNIEGISDTPVEPLSVSSIREKSRQLFVKPDVVKGDNGKYYVSCCCWNDFCGMQQEVVEIAISQEGKVALIKDIMSTSLFSCNYGVRF